MTYTLTIDLVGADKAEGILAALKASMKGLKSGTGNIFQPSGGSSGISKQTEDVARLTRQVQAGTVGVHALGKELKNLGNSPGANFLKGAMLSKTQAFWDLNPGLKDMLSGAGTTAAGSGSAAGKFKGVYWTSKEMLGHPRLPDVSQFLPKGADTFIKGLRDVGGKDLEKVLKMGAFEDIGKGITKGLREVTGADLAKVHALPDINEIYGGDEQKKSNASKRSLAKAEKDLEAFTKNMALVVGPIFNPGGALSTAFSARQVFSAFTTQKGQGILGNFGLSGASGAMVGAAVFTAAATAVGLALKGLAKIIEETFKAIENARQLYAKALTGGMGLQWTVKRSLMAEIIGVSERDVFRFGAQMAYLNPKLEQASQILAKTATPLTAVSYNMKVLDADLQALWATIASELAPAINGVVLGLQGLVEWFNRLANNPIFKTGIEGIALGALGGGGIIARIFSMIGGSEMNHMPSPQAWMKQLPASAWEHMGLVIGPQAQNYARDTARNTGQIAKDISKLVKNMGIGKGRGTSMWGGGLTTNNP